MRREQIEEEEVIELRYVEKIIGYFYSTLVREDKEEHKSKAFLTATCPPSCV